MMGQSQVQQTLFALRTSKPFCCCLPFIRQAQQGSGGGGGGGSGLGGVAIFPVEPRDSQRNRETRLSASAKSLRAEASSLLANQEWVVEKHRTSPN